MSASRGSSAARSPTSWRWRTTRCRPNSGSARRTSCRAWRGRHSSTSRGTSAMSSSCRTGISTPSSRPIPSPRRRRRRRSRSTSRAPTRSCRSLERRGTPMMKKALLGLVGLLAVTLFDQSAHAWMHAGRYGTASGGGGSWQAHGWNGGSASGGGGSWSAHGAYGGSASGGGGSWHATGAYGGTASGGGGSWHATGAYGNTAYGGYDHYNGAYYGAYHQP